MESCPQREKKRPKIEQQALLVVGFWFWLLRPSLRKQTLRMDIFGLTKYTEAFGYNSDNGSSVPHLSRISNPVHSKH